MIEKKSEDNHKLVVPKQTLDGVSKYFMSKASLCDKDHLMSCDCQSKLVNEIKASTRGKYLERAKKYCQDNDINFNTDNFIVRAQLQNGDSEAYKLAGRLLKKDGIRCSKEETAINELLTRFAIKRDLSDPEVFSIIESLVNMKLSILRYSRASEQQGLFITTTNSEGQTSKSLSGLEKLKLEYEKACITSIVSLNKMVEGEKHNITASVTHDIIPMGDLYGSPKNLQGPKLIKGNHNDKEN